MRGVERCNVRRRSPTFSHVLLCSPIHTTCGPWFLFQFQRGYLPRHPIPDTVSLAGVQLDGDAPRSRPTPSQQMPLCSDTIFIVSAVGGDGNRCCSRRRGFLVLFLSFFFFFYCTPRPSAAAGTSGPSRPPSPLLNSSSGR